MGNMARTQAVVISGAAQKNQHTSLELVLVNPDGTAAGTVKKAAAQADTTAVDIAAMRVDFNLLLAKLRTAGVIAT
jgi:hypothetical protein